MSSAAVPAMRTTGQASSPLVASASYGPVHGGAGFWPVTAQLKRVACDEESPNCSYRAIQVRHRE